MKRKLIFTCIYLLLVTAALILFLHCTQKEKFPEFNNEKFSSFIDEDDQGNDDERDEISKEKEFCIE